MSNREYRARNSDEETQIRIESMTAFCPKCGNEAELIWSVANGYHHASWHCHYCEWFTTDPEPFRENPQRFKTLFDF